MKITITRRELKSMTTGFSKVVPGKGTLQILSCVCFRSNNKKVSAEVTDLDQTAVYDLDLNAAEGEGVILVPLALLRKLSKGTDKETVNLENDGDNILVTNNVGSHAVTQSIPVPDQEEWPPAGSDIRTAPAPGFISAYKRLIPFASNDETRMAICSVYVDVSGAGEHNATLVATDGRRLSCCNSMKLPISDKAGVIVPVSKFLQWNGLPEEVEIGMSKTKDITRFCISAGSWTYRVKTYDGTYPNWRQVIPDAGSLSHKIVFTDAEVKGLRNIIPAFPGEESIALEGTAEGKVSLCGMDHESVKALTVPLTAGSIYTGDGCRIIINRNSLLDALNAGFRSFMFADKVSPLLSNDGKGGTHVLMPLRPNGPASAPVTPDSANEKETQTSTATQQPVADTPHVPEQIKEKVKMPEKMVIPTFVWVKQKMLLVDKVI